MFFLNKTKKVIYIIFALIFLSIISLNHSKASNHILVVEELKISEKIDLEFSRNKVIDIAFKKAFHRLLGTILKSSDIIKLANIDIEEIRNIIENFKIRNEIFRKGNYHASFDVYFSKQKVKFFLEKKNLFYSNPKKVSVLFFPIIVEQENLYFFQENIFYNNWLLDVEESGLINYIMPIEDIDEILQLISSQRDLEDLDIIKIAKKYDTENYILNLIYLNKNRLNFFFKIKLEGYKKNSNLVFYEADIEDKEFVSSIIKKTKLHLNDIWKDFNEVNTSIKLSMEMVLNTNNSEKIYQFENTLNKIDDIRFFSINKFDLNKTVYEVVYNTNPNKLIKQLSIYGFQIIKDERRWVVQ